MAADLAETRKFCAQSLWKAGRLCGVTLIRDSASRDTVEEFAEAIQSSGRPAEQRLGLQLYVVVFKCMLS